MTTIMLQMLLLLLSMTMIFVTTHMAWSAAAKCNHDNTDADYNSSNVGQRIQHGLQQQPMVSQRQQ